MHSVVIHSVNRKENMKMKNIYINPTLEIVTLADEDVISTSFGDGPIAIGNPNGVEWGDF